MLRTKPRLVAICLGLILAALVAASAARADSFTWCNVPGPGVGTLVDGSTTDWNSAGLWWNGTANVNWPAGGASAVFTYSGTGNATLTINSPTIIQGITSQSDQYTISNLGNASLFQLSGTLNMPGSSEILDGGITFNGPISAVNAVGGFVLQGSVSNVGTDTFTFAGSTLSLNKSGSAVAIPGPLVMSSGTALVSSATQLSPSSPISLSGGNLAVTATSGVFPQPVTVNAPYCSIGVSSTGGNVSFTGNMALNNSVSLVANDASSAATFAGSISGTGGIFVGGVGTTILAGSNIYSGPTSVVGNLLLCSSSALPPASGLEITLGQCDLNGYNMSVSTLNVSGGTLTNSSLTFAKLAVTGGSIMWADYGRPGLIAPAAGSNLTLDLSGSACTFVGQSIGGGTLSIAAPITNDGGQGLRQYGGLLQLSASNTYTGPTVIQSGTLLVPADVIAGVPGPLGNASSAILVSNTASYLEASLLISNSGVNFARPIVVQSGSAAIGGIGGAFPSGNSTFVSDISISGSTNLAAASGGTVTFNGNISGSGNVAIGGVIGQMFGAGTVVLNGANTYQGSTTLNNGTLILGSDFAPGISGPIGPGLLLLGSGKISPGGGNRTVPNPISFDGTTIFGDVGGPSLLFTGSATGGGDLTVNNTTTFADVISGAGSLIVGGSGTCILGGGSADAAPNTYTGFTIVSSGTTLLDKMAGTPVISSSLTVSGGTVISLQPGMLGSNVALRVTSGEMELNDNNLSLRSLYYTGGTIAGVAGTITLSGSTTPLTVLFTPQFNYGVALTGASPGGEPADIVCSVAMNGPINLGSVTRWFATNGGGTAQLNGVVSGGGGIALESVARVVLANSGNNYAGPTQISAGCVLYLGASQAIPAASNLIDNGTLNLAGYSEAAPAFSGTGNVTMGGGTLTLGGGGGATTFSGIIAADPGELVKSGSGSLSLTQSTSRYLGFIEVQGGTLTMAGGFQGAGAGVDVQPGTRLSLTQNTYGTDFSTIPFTNSGTVDLLSGSYSYSSGGTLGGTVNISGSGVTLSTNGNLVLPGMTSWTGGTLSSGALLGSGTISIPSGGSASITASGQSLGSGVYGMTFDVAGQATLGGSGAISGASYSTQLRIEPSGTFDLASTAGFALTNGTPTINNAGLFRKLAGTGTSSIAWRFNNTGTVEVDSGTLAFPSGGTSSGTFSISPSGAVAFVGGTFNIDGPMTVTGSAVLAGANLGGSGSASFSNLLWSSGTLSNTGDVDIAAGGSLVLGGTVAKTLSAGVLSIDGSGSWSGSGTLTTANNSGPSAVNLDATGVFELSDSDSFTTGSLSSASLNNAGLLQKLTGTGTAVLGGGWTWTNSGTIDVEKGSLVLGSGTGSGMFTIGSGASLSLTGAACNLSGATFAGSGTANLTASIVRFDSAASMSCLTVLGNGSITGSGNVTCNDLNWTGGTLAGGGVTIPSGGSLSISGNANRALSASQLTVGGSATLTTTGSLVAAGGPSTLDILSGGLFDVRSNTTFSTSGAGSGTVANAGTFSKSLSTSASLGPGWSFSNSGTINVRGGTLAMNSLTSSGAVNVAAGAVFWLTGSGNLAGTTFSNSGSVGFGVYPINSGSYALDGATLGGSGTYVFNGGTATVASPTTLAGAIAVSPIAAMKIDANTLFSGPVLFDGMLAGSGTTTFQNLSFEGAMSGSGTTAIASGGTLTMPAIGLSYISRPLVNSGLLALANSNGVTTVSSAIVNQSSGTVSLALTTAANLTGTGTISTAGLFEVQRGASSSCVLAMNLDNSGTMETVGANVTVGPVAQLSGGTLTGGTWIATSNGSIMFTNQLLDNRAKITIDGVTSNITGLASNFENDGILTVQNQAQASWGNIVNTGTISLAVGTTAKAYIVSVQDGGLLIDNGSLYGTQMTVSTGGTLSGSGSVNNPVTLDGHLAPGGSPGTLTLSRLQTDPGCNLDFELGGASGNDLLVVSFSNGLTLGGGLVNVSDWNNGLTPGTYPLIEYSGTPLTSLGGLSVGQMPDGFSGTLLLNASGPTTVDLQVSAVPEPPPLVLLGGGLIVVFLLPRPGSMKLHPVAPAGSFKDSPRRPGPLG